MGFPPVCVPSVLTRIVCFQEGYTPLAVTIRENHVEMAEFLLKEGSDYNITEQGQRSPPPPASSYTSTLFENASLDLYHALFFFFHAVVFSRHWSGPLGRR